MQFFRAGVFVALLAAGSASAENPLGKVMSLLDDLAAKVTKDGIAEEKAFKEYMAYCDDLTATQQFTIKTAKAKKEELESVIAKAAADAEAAEGKIEDLAAKIAQAEGEVKDATLIREKEASEFVTAEADLSATIGALNRAVSIIEKEMAKNPAAFMQVDASNTKSLVAALSSIVDAASFNVADKQRLVAFVQNQQTDAVDADDDAPGSPAAAAYKSHSGEILDVLEDLKSKAEEQLAAIRKAESNAKHNFAMLKQSLEDQAAYDTKSMTDEKSFLAQTEETKASATGELETTAKSLADTESMLASSQTTCMSTAADHDSSVAARKEELETIARAKKVLQETMSGAVEQGYSFVQIAGSSLMNGKDLRNLEVVRFVKKLARDQHSQALAQLASKISAIAQYGAGAGEDPFVKVKGLIRDMITKLESEADAAATEKAYCDEQLAKTEAKKSELEDDIATLTSKIDVKSARSAQLKEEVKVVQSSLAAMAKEQAELTAIRSEENAAYKTAKADLELGLSGVREALTVLRKYYQGEGAALVQSDAQSDADSTDEQPTPPVTHSKSSGAGGSIIDILEVVESDFAKSLADEETAEADAAAAFEKSTQEIKVDTALKSQDLKYKVQEFKGLDKDVTELSGDRTSTDSELTAVLEYYGKVKERCIAKPETYEERASRRQAEISGLKEALSILNDETAPGLVQVHRHGMLRASA